MQASHTGRPHSLGAVSLGMVGTACFYSLEVATSSIMHCCEKIQEMETWTSLHSRLVPGALETGTPAEELREALGIRKVGCLGLQQQRCDWEAGA